MFPMHLIAALGTQSGFSETYETPVTVAANADWLDVAYIGSSKAVFVYRDFNGQRGTAVVGTISGNSISFGAPAVFETGSTSSISITDIGSDKVVVAYRDAGNSGYGTAVVGTVSGTGISFGSPSVFVSRDVSYVSVSNIGSNKVFISFDNSFGSDATGIVGTVSGSSISYGGTNIFGSVVSAGSWACENGADAGVGVSWELTDGDRGMAVTYSVSGSVISYGSDTTFYSGSARDPKVDIIATNKIAIVFADNENSNRGSAIVGTISGSALTFGSIDVFEAGGISYQYIIKTNEDQFLAVYADDGDGGKLKAVLCDVSGTTITSGAPVTIYANLALYIRGCPLDDGGVLIVYRQGGSGPSVCVIGR